MVTLKTFGKKDGRPLVSATLAGGHSQVTITITPTGDQPAYDMIALANALNTPEFRIIIAPPDRPCQQITPVEIATI